MKELTDAVQTAGRIIVIADGREHCFEKGDAAFRAIIKAWNEMTATAIRMGNETGAVDRIPLRKRNKLRGNGFRSAFGLRKGGIQRVQRGAPCAGEVSGTLLLCRPFRRRYVRICGCGKESGGAS